MALTVEEVEAVLRLRDELSSKLRTVNSNLGQTQGFLSSAASALTGFVGAQAIIGAVGGAFSMLKNAAMGMNQTLETSTLQFTTLMGDADKARQHVEYLFEFAKKTPFETGPIIQASRMMQTFGGEALNSQKNLQLLGDASAATSAPIDQLGFWVGRLYAMLKGGQPFGEAAMRLQELAVLTPEARQKMEALQKAGGSTSEVFGVFQQSLEKFTGGMVKQAGTWAGVTSTFTDTVNILSAKAMKPLFTTMRDLLGSMNEVFGSDEFEKKAEALSNVIASGLNVAIDATKSLFSTLSGVVETVRTNFQNLQSSGLDLKMVWQEIQGLGEGLYSILGSLFTAVQNVYAASGSMSTAWSAILTVGGALWDIFKLIFDVVVAVNEKFGLLEKIGTVVGTVMKAFYTRLEQVGNALSWVADKLRWLLESVGLLEEETQSATDVALTPAVEVLDELEGAAGNLGSTLTGSVVPAIGSLNEGMEETRVLSEKQVKALAKQAQELRDYYNWVGEREIELAAQKLKAEKDYADGQRQIMNDIGVAQMEAEAKRREEHKKTIDAFQKAERDWMNEQGLRLMEMDQKNALHWSTKALGYVQNFIKNSSAELGKLQTFVTGHLTKIFGGGGLMETIIGGGLNMVFGPVGGLVGKLFKEGFDQLVNIAWEGLKKIGGFFKKLFGGPSAEELAGREVVSKFEENLHKMLNDSQKLEAGNDSWKMTVVAIRDAYIAAGLSEQQALTDAERLWKSSKMSAEEQKKVIDDITKNMQGFGDAARDAGDAIKNIPRDIVINGRYNIPDFPTAGEPLPEYHKGGRVPRTGVALLRAGETVTPPGGGRGRGEGFSQILGALQAILEEQQSQRVLLPRLIKAGAQL